MSGSKSKGDWATRLFPALFSYADSQSSVNRFRRNRMAKVHALLASIKPGHGKTSILDIGGTLTFWQHTGLLDPGRFDLTLLNLEAEVIPPTIKSICSVAGSALAIPFPDKSFDVVFSNSVIEHVGSRHGQEIMAAEVRRVGHRYVIQTPGYWFPLEPHSRIPFFQFAPRWLRALLIRHFKINYFPAGKSFKECLLVSDSTIMLTYREFKKLFPEAVITTERFAGLAKSYTAFGGWSEAS